MMRRNLIVVFKPVKNNSVVLSELNHRLMMLNDNKNSCLNLVNNNVDYYCSWLPYGNQSIRDTEIGINSSVAEAIGLYDGAIVSCRVVDDLPTLETVYVTATNQKDWEILEASSYRIQNTLLDQTRIINGDKNLIVWINSAIHITLKIEKLQPETKYGKIERNTEIIVKPFNGTVQSDKRIKSEVEPPSEHIDDRSLNHNHNQSQSSLYNRLYKKDGKNGTISSSPQRQSESQPKTNGKIIDSTTLDNVSEKSSSDESSDEDSDGTVYDGNAQTLTNNSNSSLLSKDESSSKKPKIKLPRLDVQTRLFDAMLAEVKSQDRKTYKFRAIPKKWSRCFLLSDVFLTKHNIPNDFDPKSIYIMNCETLNDSGELVTKEYYVNIKVVAESAEIPKNIYPSIELHDILLAQLKLPKFSRVTLSTKKTVLNFIEKIELIPVNTSPESMNKQDIMEDFKRLLIKCSRSAPILINQEQIFKVGEGNNFVVAKIYPESFRYCLCDAEILRENKLVMNSEIQRDITQILTAAEEISSFRNSKRNEETKSFVYLNENENIIEDCVENMVQKNCLDKFNRLQKQNNYLIIGPQTTGKSTICSKIIEKLEEPPYNCYVEEFNCAQNKSRKVCTVTSESLRRIYHKNVQQKRRRLSETESIQKDLRHILTRCVDRAPSVLLLENLDTLAKSVSDHSQNGDYYNQVSDIIKYMISIYTENCAVSVIATVTNINNLNQRLYTSRGNHIFGKMFKIPELTKENRQKIIYELSVNTDLKCDNLNFTKLANLTEGYTIGYLLQFIDRAMFYAYRNDNNNPTLTNDVYLQSLKTTNEYCLQGIENNVHLDESVGNAQTSTNRFPGLEKVVSVFEEVLVWPTKYPNIFGKSPLRNQAGILLYGLPGTGKTYLVSQISRHWNLRMISVKGPELLAKFIGQSEENVRNLFDKARNAKPCVLFFDEFDSIAPRRGHDSTGVTDRVVNQLLTELDGVEELNGVVVVAATSRPELIDPALLRSGRIDRLVQCTLPDSSARLNIFKHIAESSSLRLASDINFEFFCDSKTDNYTGADIKSILVSANMIAVKESIAMNPDNVPDEIYINQSHMIDAFKNTKQSVSYADTIKYRSLYARFLNQEESSRVHFGAQRATLA